jgi:hypothetical protein
VIGNDPQPARTAAGGVRRPSRWYLGRAAVVTPILVLALLAAAWLWPRSVVNCASNTTSTSHVAEHIAALGWLLTLVALGMAIATARQDRVAGKPIGGYVVLALVDVALFFAGAVAYYVLSFPPLC